MCATDVQQTRLESAKAQVEAVLGIIYRIPDKDDVHEFKPTRVILCASYVDARKTTLFVMATEMKPDLKGAD